MTHTWKIYDLRRTIADGVVTEVTYACETNFSGSETRKIGNLTITGSTEDANFIPYEDLTESTVLGWVTSSIDTAAVETLCSSSIAETIAFQAAITEATGKPW